MEIGDVHELVSENLRKYRLAQNLTIKELSQKSGVNQRFIERIENKLAKRVLISKLFVIAESLNIPIIKLFK